MKKFIILFLIFLGFTLINSSISYAETNCTASTVASHDGTFSRTWYCDNDVVGTYCSNEPNAAESIAGNCGADDGRVLTSVPTRFCAANGGGKVGPFGNNPWSWVCKGTNGAMWKNCATLPNPLNPPPQACGTVTPAVTCIAGRATRGTNCGASACAGSIAATTQGEWVAANGCGRCVGTCVARDAYVANPCPPIIDPPPLPVCVPTKTCADYSGQCGTNLNDGCADILNCSGNCSAGYTCNAGSCGCASSCLNPASTACGASLNNGCKTGCVGTGTVCSAGYTCSAGTCACTSSCLNPASTACGASLNNGCKTGCVGTGTVCSAGYTCSAGACISNTDLLKCQVSKVFPVGNIINLNAPTTWKVVPQNVNANWTGYNRVWKLVDLNNLGGKQIAITTNDTLNTIFTTIGLKNISVSINGGPVCTSISTTVVQQGGSSSEI